MDNILDDYEHLVTRTLEAHQGESLFPKLEDFHLTRRQLDDYLFEKQVILDFGTDAKTRYTVWGILIVLPVLIIDAFPHETLPWGDYSFFGAILFGVMLCAVYSLLVWVIRQVKLKRQSDPNIERFIQKVLHYQPNDGKC